MQKTINKVTYKTVKKYLVKSWESDEPYMDLYWCREELYKHPENGYYLHIEGGSGTMWHRKSGDNTYSSGEHIFPISESQAQRWIDMRFNGVFDDTLHILELD